MKYNKLVRDKIPDIIYGKGETAVIHIAGDREYREKLKEKLEEEVKEFSKDETIGGIADILEVIDAICEYKKFDIKELHAVKEKRHPNEGSLKNGSFLMKRNYTGTL